jgi:hypothetical protein
MAPMVATAAEARDFAAAVRDRGLRAGVMVEVPSAALLAYQLIEEVDFLSIGTNDLTQYTMAADRMASDLAHLTDPWQPAVLHLVAITAAAGATSVATTSAGPTATPGTTGVPWMEVTMTTPYGATALTINRNGHRTTQTQIAMKETHDRHGHAQPEHRPHGRAPRAVDAWLRAPGRVADGPAGRQGRQHLARLPLGRGADPRRAAGGARRPFRP